MKPGPRVLVTVTLSEYAETLAGMPAHGPVGSGKLRGALAGREGPPKVPAGPRVSTMRQGVTPMNGSGLVTSASARIPRPDEPGLEGTGQLDTVVPSCASAEIAANARDRITSVNVIGQVLVIPSSLRKLFDPMNR